jgi:putative ABC transport system ATP-binding protein
MSIVLDASGVIKTFIEGRQEIPVLHGVSLSVARGEIVALEGPSGSGKTTLLSILGCILTPTTGTVHVAGERVDALSPARLAGVRKRSIGFVFQQYNLFPALTALENVEYALSVKGVRCAAREQAARLLEQVGLGDRLHFLPRDLSGGQKQRVAIARALAGSPPAILADEPTANLDTTAGRQVLRLFRDLARQEGKGLLIVTHDPSVHEVADRVIGIRDGQLVGDGRDAEVQVPTREGVFA